MKIIGLTGGISTGKSTVSNYLKEKGRIVICGDTLAREVVQVGEIAYNKIKNYFGNDILNDDKTLNRRKLREIVFNDKDKLNILNGITHPEIENLFNEKVKYYESQGISIVFYDMPLLFETDLHKNCYKTIVVYIPQNIQIERLMLRDNISKELAIQMINSQMSIEDKKNLADFIVDNSKSIEETYKQINDILEKINL